MGVAPGFGGYGHTSLTAALQSLCMCHVVIVITCGDIWCTGSSCSPLVTALSAGLRSHLLSQLYSNHGKYYGDNRHLHRDVAVRWLVWLSHRHLTMQWKAVLECT